MKFKLEQSMSFLLQTNTIEDWLFYDFWTNLEIDNRNNNARQRMYRQLRNLVSYGYLSKGKAFKGSSVSLFNETEKMHELRDLLQDKLKSKEVDKIKVKLQELNSVKNQIAHKINIAPIVLNEFPTFASQILNQKLKFNMELQEVEAYSSFLSELLTINQDKLI